jgi:hypothetical protein
MARVVSGHPHFLDHGDQRVVGNARILLDELFEHRCDGLLA